MSHYPLISGRKCSGEWDSNVSWSSFGSLQAVKWHKFDPNFLDSWTYTCFQWNSIQRRRQSQHWHIYGHPCRRGCSAFWALCSLFPIEAAPTPGLLFRNWKDGVCNWNQNDALQQGRSSGLHRLQCSRGEHNAVLTNIGNLENILESLEVQRLFILHHIMLWRRTNLNWRGWLSRTIFLSQKTFS